MVLVMEPKGVVSAFGLAPAASDERPIREALAAATPKNNLSLRY